MSEEKTTLKQRIGGIVFGLVMAGLCIVMWMYPDFSFSEDDEPRRAKSRLIMWILEMIWGRVGGTVLGLVGLLLLWSSVRPGAETSAEGDS